jgi:23S rRNA (uridine2552-2'-O)-methyltransferase
MGVGSLARDKGAGGKSRSGIRDRRSAHEVVKTAKRRTTSSAQWLARQINDPYVAEARNAGYRSRAAYKLRQLDDKYRFLRAGARVVDLGASPGGWTQVAVQRVGEKGRVVALDLVEIDPVPGAEFIIGDIQAPESLEQLRVALGGDADVVLSDMAAPATGHAKTDHIRVMALAEAAHECACSILAEGGAFVVKLLVGGADRDLLTALKCNFRRARHVKPPASRSDSREIYLVASGYRGVAETVQEHNMKP